MTKELYKQAFKKFKLMRIRMKISYEAFMKEYTIPELFMRSIQNTYNQTKSQYKLSVNEHYDELMKDILKGRADLKLVVWYKNRDILEKELGFKKTTYKELYMEFIEKEIKKICLQNSSIDLFKDFNRGDDFFESV